MMLDREELEGMVVKLFIRLNCCFVLLFNDVFYGRDILFSLYIQLIEK